MRKRLRQFFWMSIISGCLMVFSAFSFTPSQVGQLLSQGSDSSSGGIKSLVKENLQSLVTYLDKKETAMKTVEGTPKVQYQYETKKIDSKKKEWAQKVYLYKGVKYVQIRGKYYKYNPRHVYNVNGERVFYKVEVSDLPENKEKKKKLRIFGGLEPEESSEGVQAKGFGAYGPANLKNLMKNLTKAKKNLEERNKILEELAQ